MKLAEGSTFMAAATAKSQSNPLRQTEVKKPQVTVSAPSRTALTKSEPALTANVMPAIEGKKAKDVEEASKVVSTPPPQSSPLPQSDFEFLPLLRATLPPSLFAAVEASIKEQSAKAASESQSQGEMPTGNAEKLRNTIAQIQANTARSLPDNKLNAKDPTNKNATTIPQPKVEPQFEPVGKTPTKLQEYTGGKVQLEATKKLSKTVQENQLAEKHVANTSTVDQTSRAYPAQALIGNTKNKNLPPAHSLIPLTISTAAANVAARDLRQAKVTEIRNAAHKNLARANSLVSADTQADSSKSENEDENKLLLPWRKQTEKGHWKCEVPGCPKVFRALEYWEKHVNNAHVEWKNQLRNLIHTIPATTNTSSKDSILVTQITNNKVPTQSTSSSITPTASDIGGRAEATATQSSKENRRPSDASTSQVPNRGRQSLALSLAIQRETLIGEHVYRTRFHTQAALLEETQSSLSALSMDDSHMSEAPLSPKTANSPKKAIVNPFGPPKQAASRPSLSTHLSGISTSNDPGAAARAQYGGGLPPQANASNTFVQPTPPSSAPRLTRSARDDLSDAFTQPTAPTPASRGGGSRPTRGGPALPAFLQGATSTADAGEAARRQYGGTGPKKGADPLEVARKRGL